MKPVPQRILSLARRMPLIVFYNHYPDGISADHGIHDALVEFLRQGCHLTLGAPERDTWSKVVIHYRTHGGDQSEIYTAIVGMKSWYDDHNNNLRIDFDRDLPGHGDCIWAPFVMAIARVSDHAPNAEYQDFEGAQFERIVLLHNPSPVNI